MILNRSRLASAGLFLLGPSLLGCPQRPPEAPGSASIVLSEDPPPAGHEALGELRVVSGKGCGLMGKPGSAEQARTLLRNAAHERGAGYVQITRYDRPPVNHQCQEHEHRLTGVAYRPVAHAEAPRPLPPPSGSVTLPGSAAPAPTVAPRSE